jgi:hypothetical protein
MSRGRYRREPASAVTLASGLRRCLRKIFGRALAAPRGGEPAQGRRANANAIEPAPVSRQMNPPCWCYVRLQMPSECRVNAKCRRAPRITVGLDPTILFRAFPMLERSRDLRYDPNGAVSAHRKSRGYSPAQHFIT